MKMELALTAIVLTALSFNSVASEKPIDFIKEITITDKSQCDIIGGECRVITSPGEARKFGSTNKTILVRIGDTIFKKCVKHPDTGKVICDKYWHLKRH